MTLSIMLKKLLVKVTPHFILKYRYLKKKQKLNKFYEGNTVECTICKSTYRQFRPYGLIERKNARCPNCNSLERHRLLWKFLHEKTDIMKPKKSIKILHFAPEPFFYRFFDNVDNVDYFPCDLYPDKYKYQGNSVIRKVDITSIPFENDYFDFILCNHVLEHITDDSLAISELYRVMKRNGQGIFQVPIIYSLEQTYEDTSLTSPEERLKAFGQEDHVRRYGCDYIDRLRLPGFEVIEHDFVKTFSKDELFKYGFEDHELIYICKKN